MSALDPHMVSFSAHRGEAGTEAAQNKDRNVVYKTERYYKFQISKYFSAADALKVTIFRVLLIVFQAPNLYVVASKSGKCTSEILNNWFEVVLKPQITSDSIILLDCFNGFNQGAAQAADESDDGRPTKRRKVYLATTNSLTLPLPTFVPTDYAHIIDCHGVDRQT